MTTNGVNPPASNPVTEALGGASDDHSKDPMYGKFWDAPEKEEEEVVLEKASPLIRLTRAFDFRPPPGLAGELHRYILTSARYPMKEGALLAALGLMAGVAGRSFNFNGTGLNLYLLLLAESGRGKEDMRGGIDRLLSTVRHTVPLVEECIGPDVFASGQALVRVLETTPCFLSIQSEFGLRLKELNDPRAPSSLIVLRRVLLDLYAKSGISSMLRPTVYSDREKNTKRVHAPCLTVLGESTPGHVFDNLSFRDIEDGLLPRCLLLQCADKRPYANPLAGQPPSPELSQRFADFAGRSISLRIRNTCEHVVSTEEAVDYLNEIQRLLDEAYNDEARDMHDRALWNRAGLNISRVAALVAVGCVESSSEPPTVEKAHVEWAAELVGHCIEELARKFRDGMVGSGESRLESEAQKYIREYLAMSQGRKLSYKVPKKLAAKNGYIGMDYIRRRARRCAAFTQDRRGFERALADTMSALCRTGAIFKLMPHQVHSIFGLRGDVYGVGNVEALT